MTRAVDEDWLDLLKGTHVAVVGVARRSAGPLLAPVWYGYDRDVGFTFILSGRSAKARRLRVEGRATICIQDDGDEYAHVTAEGPVVLRPLDADQTKLVMRPIAHRYLGAADGDAWVDRFAEPDIQLATLTPERWFGERPGNPRHDG